VTENNKNVKLQVRGSKLTVSYFEQGNPEKPLKMTLELPAKYQLLLGDPAFLGEMELIFNHIFMIVPLFRYRSYFQESLAELLKMHDTVFEVTRNLVAPVAFKMGLSGSFFQNGSTTINNSLWTGANG
jgi:hypothetical protein